VARRLIEGLARPYQVDGHEIHSSVSIGIVMSDGGNSSATDLLRYADMAMYAAKRAGRSTFAMFDRSMLTRAARAACIEDALRHAIDLDQLSLVYQPIVCLRSGEITSVEALLRWSQPELGWVSPAEFIPIAEESGLIVPIGAWVLRQACGQWRRWQDEAGAAAPQTMSVNLSRVQLAQGAQLQALVSQVLLEVGMSAENLQLEVTEREVMNEPEAARSLMNGLRTMGVRLAMDDFGTGASSLGCLRDYPFDVIKIDKSFIDGLGDNPALLAVVQATVSVIQNLGMASVAEGIEKPAQVELLRSLGCGYGQGYHFARPLPPEQVLALLPMCASAA
jgi:EAL domain-containing protein (putative c-di-GMP-specific phosphodiesterase class I)